jgi:hypothetical protein
MTLTDSLKPFFLETAAELTGAARRLLMAKVVKQLGPGGQSQAAQELGCHRGTLRKGLHELESGLTGIDNYTARGRQPCEKPLPTLLEDLQAVVDRQSQNDPKFESTRLYGRKVSAKFGVNGLNRKVILTRNCPATKRSAKHSIS